jgi:hypothetical protein
VNKLFFIFFILPFFVSGCGYRFTPNTYEGERISLTIPYIQGDPSALLNNTLAASFSNSGRFRCIQGGGDFNLEVVMLSDLNDRIGYRYDRDDVTGSRKPNVLGVENRRHIVAQLTLYNARSGSVILGPIPIKAWVDYDYVDYGSPRDLNTLTPVGTVPTIQYSYGQLNTVEGAHDDASVYLYQKLADQIVGVVSDHLFR